jgi:PHD/YefM family antitoxin component YafN of YafNO toxin-antitoxin module
MVLMRALTANDLKTRGVSAVEEGLQHNEEVLISVRGKERYVVMAIETYNRLRELELAAAVTEAKAEYAEGRYNSDSVEDHIKRISDDL